MKMKKTVSAILASLLLLTASGCQDPDVKKETELPQSTGEDAAPAAETEPETEADSEWNRLSAIDYGGYAFHILLYATPSLTEWITAEEMTGELLNDSVRERNIAV
ncbi:MAG: hypothetical protein E7576_15330 [Ruminococcaceae bacterium]|nr:hypothetical protein [Oscillospiraceae bacterium]